MTIINSVIAQGGIQPSGTTYITTNGVHDVTNYATADVQVPTTAPTYYVKKNVSNGKLTYAPDSPIINFSGITEIGDYQLAYAYYGNAYSGTLDMSDVTTVGPYACYYMCKDSNITAVDLSSITELRTPYSFSYMFAGSNISSVDFSSLNAVSGDYVCSNMFRDCTGLTSINLSNLITVTGSCFQYAFYGCTGLTSIDLSNLIIANGAGGFQYAFSGCTGLTSVNLSSLINAYGYNSLLCAFVGCTNLASVDISRLAKIGSNSALASAFRDCTSLTELRFSGLPYTTTNINASFQNTLQGVTGCTVHFPSDWATAMASYSNITNGLGGTNTTVLFDLSPVTTLDFSNVKKIDGNYAIFSYFGSTGLFPNVTKLDLSGLTEVTVTNACYSMMPSATGLTTVDLSSLKTVSGNNAFSYAFSKCASLTNVDLSSLETVLGNSTFSNAFEYCTSLTTLSFPALKTINNALVFGNMLTGCSGVTVHFPSNLSNSGIGAYNIGGTNTTVLFDLPATN